MKSNIKIGYLLSYDYEYIFNSLNLVYPFADKIVICYDKNGRTWAGNYFNIPEKVFKKINDLDYQNKIQFYADTFYIEGEEPINLDTRQRNMLAKYMGEGGWHIQIDSDEYPINFEQLTIFLKKHNYLLRNSHKTPINFFANLIVLFKKDDIGYYIVTPYIEKVCFITNLPQYKKVRTPEKGMNIMLDYHIIHQTWARSENEILQKFQNWGHKNDFNTQSYFEKWKNLNIENYTTYKNFHPITSSDWCSLQFERAKNINELILKLKHSISRDEIIFPLKWTKKVKLFLKSWL